jgi:transcriptional regulator with XRE-family HTH domain
MFDTRQRTHQEKALSILLIQRGISKAELARRLGVTRSTVCGVLSGLRKSSRVIHFTAKTLGLTVEEFVNNYLPDKAA